ncbi:rho-related BTB domain-containing protein 3 [Oncorhynchus tshawytscha]|uniref:rho-related BTB domain-containing protein 3 n=1 Tax=Oncorhynchus kisutch TaxID=8019 RepID=UPI00099F7D1B|nr:rho-related BTB domain-containing protein 3 [Oncorhynchus kisutch]XP_024283695.1 rho-related BTB domain-containing protein 3 [Oncorhynchus tshawytscha]XP_029539420.1 rho-related BTB domain-containing protein 3-like isoform X2 [Oncorhynchus nerka]XP_031681417.1 rho-related BTB domain-containing protein 3 [Oncorhynchus kisutch]XP_042180627.1 rho-related BTB domain-containing protein 3 [Oncorhynchus tshawytscha]
MSIHIVALGSECPGGARPGEEAMGQGQLQGGLLWSYLGHGAVAGGPEESSLSNSAFMEYTSRVFGDVTVVVQDCPSWDLLDSDWAGVRSVLEQADILVIKYSVNDKLAFQQVRNGYAPRLRPLLHHWGMPVILVAVGARLNDEGPPCTCPLCASDWSSCVPHSEGLQLSRDLGATYLELPSLNHVFVSRYFGSVLEYFMIQCLKQKANDRPEKRRGNKLNEPRPPHLEQPARLPPIRVEESSFSQDLQWLLERGVQFADVAFYAGDSGKELGWGHAAVLCAVSPYFRQLLLGPKARERPISRCACRGDGRGDGGPPSLLSTWDGGLGKEDGLRPDGHLAGRLSRLVVKDPLLCLCLWETLMFLYRGAWEWEHLQEAMGEKLNNSLAVAQLMDRIRSFLGRDKGPRDTPNARAAQLGPQSLVNLFNSPLYSDVIFMVQGSVLPAHRAVLVARCDVMAAMFSGKYAEARSRVVPIHGVSSDTFLSFLEYLYTDTCCPASVLQAMAVLVCAEMYQVKRLQHLCEVCVCAYLQSMPSRELASTGISVIRLLRRAKCHNAEQLYVWLLHFIANNYLIFSHKPDFLELSEEEREQVERLRWPSRGYLQELSEYQQRRRKLKKSRCLVM